MKTIGLIGGMSWESTVPYYQIINEEINRRCGGLHSAKILMYSVDFAEIEANMTKGDWATNAAILTDIAVRLEKAGADFILICTNTLHKVAPEVQSHISVPIIHIADAVSEALLARGITKAGLLGTKYTMQQDFYKERMIARGIEVITPDEHDMERVNDIIFGELCLGQFKDESRKEYAAIIEKLAAKGAQGIVFGCTEIGLLLKPEDSCLQVFDTTVIHAKKAAALALETM
ncbi:MAG: aspartate/glutamate racemase family protein [Clostridia bacterium]|nr:aspartate/glutamate racemase family protein [Clostridia bacterium]